MSTYYGSWISTDDWRAVMDVTTSTSNTSVSFTVVGKCESVYAYSTSWKGTLTSNGSGGTNSKTFECSTNQTVSFKTNTFSVSRGTSAKTVTVKCAVYNGNYGKTSTATATITVPAKPSYTVSYNANNGSGAPSSQTKWYGETLTLSSTEPTRTGYTFLGWSTSSTATSATYSAGGSYTSNSDATLYAVWKACNLIHVYNSNGQVKQGLVTVYNSNGNACQCIITVYDANGKAKSAQ